MYPKQLQIRYQKISLFYIGVLILSLLTACDGPTPVPKPRGFHRLQLPAHSYQKFEHPNCPYTFEYPTYGKLELNRIDSCFYNVYFPTFDCKWHITLREFGKKGATPAYAYEDFREVVYKHAQKGTIYERNLRNGQGSGVLYELYGEVPTPAQLYFTDSSRYAVLYSFYFNTNAKNDSLQPIIEHLKKDMLHSIESLKWK